MRGICICGFGPRTRELKIKVSSFISEGFEFPGNANLRIGVRQCANQEMGVSGELILKFAFHLRPHDLDTLRPSD
jgi:hypothetical protein